MEKYKYKKISEIEPILGFNKCESAILLENGIDTEEKLKETIPDGFKPISEKIREYMWNNCSLIGVEKFKEILEQFKDKKICVISDYDSDGIMGATILRLTLERLGYDAFHVIPDRLLDGFAMKNQHIDKAIAGGAELIITVDNGTSAIEPIAYAKEKGLTVIVTDHHLAENGLPQADLIINPHVSLR